MRDRRSRFLVRCWAGLAVILLVGCAASGNRRELTAYDLGNRSEARGGGAGLSRVEIVAPSWLAGSNMQYRSEAYPGQRRAYAESRWVAAPAEMLETGLKRGLRPGGGKCRLRGELDEFVQTFDAGGESRARIELRTVLTTGRGDSLGQKVFMLEAAAGRDAKAGAQAFAGLQAALIEQVAQWLELQAELDKKCLL